MTKQPPHSNRKKRSTELNAIKFVAKGLKSGYADLVSSDLPKQMQDLLRELDGVALLSASAPLAGRSV